MDDLQSNSIEKTKSIHQIMRMKLIRLFIEYNFFKDEFDFKKFMGDYIKEMSPREISLINDIFQEDKPFRLNRIFDELKSNFQDAKLKQFQNDYFELTTKPKAHCVLKIIYTINNGIKPEFHVYTREQEEFKMLQPSEAQRFGLYLRIKTPDKKDGEPVIDREKIIKNIEKAGNSLIENGYKISRRDKFEVFQELLKEYSTMEKD